MAEEMVPATEGERHAIRLREIRQGAMLNMAKDQFALSWNMNQRFLRTADHTRCKLKKSKKANCI